jgi:hypothetical protein
MLKIYTAEKLNISETSLLTDDNITLQTITCVERFTQDLYEN